MKARIATILLVVVTLCAFAMVSTTSATAASKKEKAEETVDKVKKSTKKVKKSAKKTTDSAKGLLKGEKININKASKEDLMKLPGIGEVKADAIIKKRKKGKFTSAKDLMERVDGIGPTIQENIKSHLKF